MSISRYPILYIILLYISIGLYIKLLNLVYNSYFLSVKDSLQARQQAIYVRNFHQGFDYSHTGRSSSPSFQKQDDSNSASNDDLEVDQSTTLSSVLFSSETSMSNPPSTMETIKDTETAKEFIFTTDRSTSFQNSTYSSKNISFSSTKTENGDFDYREPTPSFEQINQTMNIFANNNSTKSTFIQNNTDLLVDWSNKTHIVRKILPINKQYDTNSTTLEEAAKQLADRKFMQSFVHLLPSNIWPAIQPNQSIVLPNRTNYIQSALPNPVLLAEAAAQAGLPGPGPYPIPEHLWPHNSLQQTMPKFPKTSKYIRKDEKTSFNKIYHILASTNRPIFVMDTTTSRPRPFVTVKPAASPPKTNNVHSLFSQLGFSCPMGVNNIRFPDRRLCNMYYTCLPSGLPEPNLCPEGHLFSEYSFECELAFKVNCGTRVAAYFEPEDTQYDPITTTSQPKITGVNGTIECILGSDGYYEDPLYCNVYHHCIAGMDYVEHCPNQLAWNEEKKMCDWYVFNHLTKLIYINILLGQQT